MMFSPPMVLLFMTLLSIGPLLVLFNILLSPDPIFLMPWIKQVSFFTLQQLNILLLLSGLCVISRVLFIMALLFRVPQNHYLLDTLMRIGHVVSKLRIPLMAIRYFLEEIAFLGVLRNNLQSLDRVVNLNTGLWQILLLKLSGLLISCVT